jgi:hypothetical protein
LPWTTVLAFNIAFHIISEQTVLVASYSFLIYFISHSAWRSAIDPRPIHVASVVNKVTMGQAFLKCFAVVISIVPQNLHVRIPFIYQ